jgi:hypothetical protein
VKKRAPRKQKPRPPRSGRSSGHVNLNGTPKTAYPSEAQARAAANVAWAESRVELTSYVCEICNRWHNGKPFAGEQFE